MKIYSLAHFLQSSYLRKKLDTMTKEQYARATSALGEVVKWESIRDNLKKAYENDREIVFTFSEGTDKECILNTSRENITGFVYNSLMEKICENLREAEETFASI